MCKIITIHSFRGGTGKSSITSNIALELLKQNKKILIVDTDIQSPGIYVFFNIDQSKIKYTLNDYLWDDCNIIDTIYDCSNIIKSEGKLYLAVSSMKTNYISKIVREGYDVEILAQGIYDLIDILNLEYVLLDTHPGTNEETLLSMAISDKLLIVMRPDEQDIQGTAVAIDVARQLNVSNINIVINKIPDDLDKSQLKIDVESAYNCKVVASIPHLNNMMLLGSRNVYGLHYPETIVSIEIRNIIDHLN